MLKELNSYEWMEVFGDEGASNGKPIPQPSPPSYSGSLSQFSREDVAEIFQMIEGENDGDSWIIYGRLADGRFFDSRGWCDYTGFDCQSAISCDVAATKDDIIRFGLTLEERKRFGIQELN